MRTAQAIIDEALELVGQKVPGVTITNDRYTSYVSRLNDMMFELETKSINLGYSEISEKSEQLTVPRWSYSFIIHALAIYLSGYEPEIPISTTVIAKHDELKKNVLRMCTRIPREPFLPAITPMGNRDRRRGGTRRRFYGKPGADDVYSETGVVEGEDGEIVEQEID